MVFISSHPQQHLGVTLRPLVMEVLYEQQPPPARRWTDTIWHDRTCGENGESEGDYPVSLRELIASPNATYDVLERLGRGTFGQVVKCWRKDSNEVVAMKILKSTPSYAKQGQMEVDVLTRLSRLSSEDGSFVRAYESFQHRGHICIVFELLHTNLYDYLKQTRFEPLPLKYIRPIAQQVLSCLEKLSTLGLVHADLKPENIMLVNPQRYPFKVKVIDFGSAMSRSKTSQSCYLQSRYYRAPEVILGVPFDESIDIWSLGCVLAELLLGWPLFPGSCEFDQITYICQTLGATGCGGLPNCLLRNISKTSRFFNCDPNTRQWSLKSTSQYTQETGIHSKESRKYIFRSLLDISHVLTPSTSNIDDQESILTSVDRMEIISLLSRMLCLDPNQRIRPSAALQMSFITMQHLSSHAHTPTVWEWIQCMQVCRQTRIPSLQINPSPSPIQLMASGCCGHFHVLPATQFYPILPQTHLVCHVAPSTLGYLPVTPNVNIPYRLEQPLHTHPQVIINPWIDSRGCQCNSTGHFGTTQVNPLIIQDGGTSSHLHGNQVDASQVYTKKLLPLQLPAYHPFSRL